MNVFTYGDDFSVPGEIIPACGARRVNILDMREPQITLHRTYAQQMSSKNDFEKHELIIYAHDHTVTLSELQYAAAEFRKLDPQLERILIFLSPENFRENITPLAHLKFERDERRESAGARDFCVTKICKVKKAA